MSKESKHVRVFKQQHLRDGEQVRAFAAGYIGKLMGKGDDQQFNGALIVTDQRVNFYRKGLMGEKLQSIDLAKVSAVDQSSSLMSHSVEVHTSNKTLRFTTQDKAGRESLMAAINK